MDLRKDPRDNCYDTRFEPDVILNDSSSDESPYETVLKACIYKNLEMQLESHRRRHSTSTPATSPDSSPLQQCPECKKYFKRLAQHLQNHETIKSDPERPFTCTYCQKLFKNLSNLTVHVRSHTGLKPFVCNVCSRGFTQSGNLRHHMRIHSGLRPYKCDVCDRAFTQSGNLTNHMRLHSQEKPFRCHLCDRAFTQSSNLNSHLKNNHKDI